MRNILVTGGAGYIGSILTRRLLEKGYRVRVLDVLKFGKESLREIEDDPNFELCIADIRDHKEVGKALKGMDAVIHLAAIVGDPACKKEPELAKEINLEASQSLLRTGQQNDLKRFVFISTCSNYGKMTDPDGSVDENSPLRPVSLYAELKVKFEEQLLLAKYSNEFTVVGLRFATAYGVSPRMRFDLTVNEFTKDLCLGKELIVFGEQFWRPYCHIEDLSNACIAALEADRKLVHKNVFNVGDNRENYQKKTIVELIKDRLPESRVKFVHKDEDPRDYRVNFDKIKRVLNFEVTRRLPDGIDEILQHIRSGKLQDIESEIYLNS